MLICSRACAYALRALVRLAQEGEGASLKAKDIAARENIPYAFLAKVLHQLVKSGLVSSSPGLTGGFRLRHPPSKIALIQVVEAVDGLTQFNQCLTGIAQCNEVSPCPMHESWKEVKAEILKYLQETTLAQVVEAWNKKPARDADSSQQTVSGAAAGHWNQLVAWTSAKQQQNGQAEGVFSQAGVDTAEDFIDYPQPMD